MALLFLSRYSFSQRVCIYTSCKPSQNRCHKLRHVFLASHAPWVGYR